MISAGEASGDLHAANLVTALHKMDPTIKVHGMGSDHMREAGVELLYDCRDIAVMGIVEVLAKWGTIMAALDILKESLEKRPPDLLILVDYQEFNMKLAKAAKKLGIKVMFYIGPSVWAWRSHRVKKIGRRVDMMAVLFPFEEDFYRRANVPVRFVGNPLVDEVKATMSLAAAQAKFDLDPARTTIGLFPGSRRSEIYNLLPTQLAAASLIHQQQPATQFILPLAKSVSETELQPMLALHPGLPLRIVHSHIHDVMQCCYAVISASGTATLETALMATPMVIIYKMSNLTYKIMKRMITIEHVGLPNIVAGKGVVKELLQDDASPENIAGEILLMINDKNYHQQITTELQAIRSKLGSAGGSQKVAELALGMLHSPQTTSNKSGS
ncbi:MAG: lipid-A-disaccharide synthase [Gammaproteobacteria bacterium]|nr:lipid-A-disaccharide synthase [Gammaproteobacteria bacterium]